jgi:dipeptidyl aminopeptidase/acylaminoacyl peptidase
MGERRKPTTAEQAVPWLIGLVLALAGIVIVLMALIFTAEGGIGGTGSPTPRASGLVPAISSGASGSGRASASASASASAPSIAPSTPTPVPVPAYGALEMLYLSRSTASAPIYLYRRDFSLDEEPVTLARADQGIEQYAWSPDGRRGVAIIAGRAVALQQDTAARALADGVTEVAFGNDSKTVFAARVARDAGNDVAQVLAIDWESGEQEIIASATYAHPQVAAKPALDDAQFIDDGGLVRLYPTTDGNVLLWIMGAPTAWMIDPATKDVTDTSGLPALESPDELFRVNLAEGNPNTLTLVDAEGDERATTQVEGRISHLRWAPNSSEVSFTVGRLGANGGIVQNLYVWDLVDGKEPTMITSNGASFGAEWRGGAVRWVHEPTS